MSTIFYETIDRNSFQNGQDGHYSEESTQESADLNLKENLNKIIEIEQKGQHEEMDQFEVKTLNPSELRNIFNGSQSFNHEGEHKDYTQAINPFQNRNNNQSDNKQQSIKIIDEENEEEEEEDNDEEKQQQIKQSLQQQESEEEEDICDKIIPLYDNFASSEDCGIVGILQAEGIIEDDEEEEVGIMAQDNMLIPAQKSNYGSIKYNSSQSLQIQKIFNQECGFLNTNEMIYFQKTESSYQEEFFQTNDQIVIEAPYSNYQISKKGTVESSQKEIACEDIMIGRELTVIDQRNQNEVSVNDIATYNKECSKIHCRIITKYHLGLEHPSLRITNSFFAYFDRKYSLQTKNNQQHDSVTLALLQPNIQNTIRRFLDEKSSLYLVDLNSKNGTQINIPHTKSTRLQVGQCIRVSTVNMNVEDISNTSYYNSFTILMSEMIVDQLKVSLGSSVKSSICKGLPKEYQEIFDKCLFKIQKSFLAQWSGKQILNEDKQYLQLKKAEALIQHELNERCLEKLEMIPYLKLKLHQYRKECGISTNYYFFYDESKPRTFSIGRNSDNDIQLIEFGVSRYQCEIKYDSINTQWKIIDGQKIGNEQKEERKPSLSGTWINLQNISKQSSYLETIYPLNLEDKIQIGSYQMCIKENIN